MSKDEDDQIFTIDISHLDREPVIGDEIRVERRDGRIMFVRVVALSGSRGRR